MPISVLDFSLEKVNWRDVLTCFDFRAAAQKIAAATPSPFDDLAIGYIADALEEFVESLLPKPTMQTFAAPAPVTEEMILKRAKVLGVSLNPVVLSILMSLAWPLIERLLERWAKK